MLEYRMGESDESSNEPNDYNSGSSTQSETTVPAHIYDLM